MPNSSATQESPTRRLDLSAAWVGEWRPIWVSPFYTVMLVLVAIVMTILPILYLAFVAAVGYGLQWYARHGLGFLHRPNSGSSRFNARADLFQFVVIYLVPLIIGGCLFLFLLKPLFVRPGRADQPLDLRPEEEPWLFQFVHELCDRIGVPRPKAIVVDGQVNASASFRRGLLSLFVPGDLTLTIGMPLVMGLSLNQFAGVMAHEFGHFRQRVAMRAGLVIHHVISWFAMRAFGRDALDEALAASRVSADSWLISIIIGIAQLCIWVARLALMGLAIVAAAIASGLARQMEFNADRVEARLVGSAESATLTRRMAELSAAQEIAFEQARLMYRDSKRVPEDLPSLVAAASRRLSPSQREAVEKELDNHRSEWFSTHPASGARLAAIKRADEPGIFRSNLTTADLFMNLRDVNRHASHKMYLQVLGPFMQGTTLVPTDDLLAGHAETERRLSRVEEYLGFVPPTWRPFAPRLGQVLPPADPKATLRQWRAARDAMSKQGRDAESPKAFSEAEEQLTRCERADTMLRHKLGKIDAAMKIVPATPSGVSAARTAAQGMMADAAAAIDDRAEAAAKRMAAALQLLAVDGLRKHVPQGDVLLARAALVAPAVGALASCGAAVRELRLALAGTEPLAEFAVGKTVDQRKAIIEPLRERLRSTRAIIQRIDDALNVPDPQASSGGLLEQRLGSRITGGETARNQEHDVFLAGRGTADRAVNAQREMAGELIEIVMRVEDALLAMERKQAAAKIASTPGGRAYDKQK